MLNTPKLSTEFLTVGLGCSKYGFGEVIGYNYSVLFDEAGKMDHMKGILYSGDAALTIGGLKAGEICSSDMYPELQERVLAQDIHRTIEGEQDFHYKFLLIKSKPHIIYYMGNLDLLHQPLLAIVGPRMHSRYANEVLDKLFALAPSYQFATISGLAPGVDQLCHRLSLAKGIPTIAVLGGGLQHFLASGDRSLIDQIVANGGLVISEFKLTQEPQTYTFPQRNRIIAGLADVVFLPEAGTKSGSLITANFAIDMGRPVYGVPNSIFSPTSTGVNQLISSGAIHAVTDIQLFLDKSFTKKSSTQTILELPDLSPDEQSLLSLLGSNQACSLMDFVGNGSLSTSEIISLLTLLEMKQYVHQSSPGMYQISL